MPYFLIVGETWVAFICISFLGQDRDNRSIGRGRFRLKKNEGGDQKGPSSVRAVSGGHVLDYFAKQQRRELKYPDPRKVILASPP